MWRDDICAKIGGGNSREMKGWDTVSHKFSGGGWLAVARGVLSDTGPANVLGQTGLLNQVESCVPNMHKFQFRFD